MIDAQTARTLTTTAKENQRKKEERERRSWICKAVAWADDCVSQMLESRIEEVAREGYSGFCVYCNGQGWGFGTEHSVKIPYMFVPNQNDVRDMFFAMVGAEMEEMGFKVRVYCKNTMDVSW